MGNLVKRCLHLKLLLMVYVLGRLSKEYLRTQVEMVIL
jgi:hypothetical protein